MLKFLSFFFGVLGVLIFPLVFETLIHKYKKQHLMKEFYIIAILIIAIVIMLIINLQ